MSGKYEVNIARSIDDVWGNISIPGFFAKVFVGASGADKVQGYRPEEQVAIKGEVSGRSYSSSFKVESRDLENRKITYRSGQTVFEIELSDDGDNTVLNLTMRSQVQDDFVLEIYARSLANRIKGILEGFSDEE